MYLMTRNPAVKSLRDFTDKDRIAVPGIKTSLPAVLLNMAVAKELGDANYAKLDPITVAFNLPQRYVTDALKLLAGNTGGGGKVTAILPEGRGSRDGRLQFVDSQIDDIGVGHLGDQVGFTDGQLSRVAALYPLISLAHIVGQRLPGRVDDDAGDAVNRLIRAYQMHRAPVGQK